MASTFLKGELQKHPSFSIPGELRVADWNPLRAGWYSFAFVRHPVERLLSCWRSKIFSDRFFIFDLTASQANSMKDLDFFLDFVENQDLSCCDPHLSYQVANIPIQNVSFLGKLESLASDVMNLNAQTGLALNPHAKPPNPTKKTTITPDQRKRIENIYSVDMEILRYK